MKKITFLLVILTFYSCFQTIDDTDKVCSSDCTVLQGRIVTMDNQGMSGVNLTFEFSNSSELSSYTRMISDINSDEDGNFYAEFYLKDKEIDESTFGSLILRINESSLNLNETIITPDSANIILNRRFRTNSRDTIFEQNYYFPKKTHLVVNLNNFVPIQENDRFEVRTIFPYGYETPEPDEYNETLETIYIPTYSKPYSATELNNSLNIIVAENEKNIIRIYKTKNGVISYEDLVIDVTSSSPDEITLEF